MRLVKTIITFSLLCISLLPAMAKDLAVTGRTYGIAERDALDELEGRVKAVDWQKHLKSIKPANYRPANLISLPRAIKTQTFLVDMSYTLENDIVNDKGELIYPKGYMFNPLDYIQYKRTLVIINGEDPDQIRWFRSSELKKRLDVSLFITHGASLELAKKMKRPVFYATNSLIGRFQLKAVPSIIKANGRNMEINEVVVHRSEE